MCALHIIFSFVFPFILPRLAYLIELKFLGVEWYIRFNKSAHQSPSLHSLSLPLPLSCVHVHIYGTVYKLKPLTFSESGHFHFDFEHYHLQLLGLVWTGRQKFTRLKPHLMFTNIRSICFTVTYQMERIKALLRQRVDVKYSGAFGIYKCIIGEILYLYNSRISRNPG